MEPVYSDENRIKNIVRQMVSVSRCAFQLKNDVDSLSGSTRRQSGKAAAVSEENVVTGKGISEIRSDAESLRTNALNVDSAVKNGMRKQGKFLEEVEKLSEKINIGSEFLGSFRKSTEEISSLTNIILYLSGRLDVLSINGAIEAARQGSNGAGFGVIAKEMKKLAEKTQMSAKKVEDFILKYNRTSEEIQRIFNLSFENIEVTKCHASDIYDEFVKIDSQSTAVSVNSDNINTLVESLSEQNMRRERAVQEIFGIAEKIVLQVKSVDEQSVEMHQVVDALLENVGHIKFDWHEYAYEAISDLAEGYKLSGLSLTGHLRESIRKYQFIELLYAMNEDGIQLEDNIVNPGIADRADCGGKGADRSGKDYYSCIASGNSRYISGIYISSATNRFCLTISVPLVHEGENCVLAADINLENFVDL